MNSSNNIKNALQVMYKTYENVQKLMDYAKIVAQEKTSYRLVTPKFLRRKSDIDTKAWLINSFIILFQDSEKPDCESGNEWKDAPVYVMNIFLGDEHFEEDIFPSIYLSKFEYDDINGFKTGCPVSDNWLFLYPLWNEDCFNFTEIDEYRIGETIDGKPSSTYRGLKKHTTYRMDLVDITAENLKEKIFDRFDEMEKLESAK